MLTRCQEADFRPFFHGHFEVHPGWRNIGEIAGMIERKVGAMPVFEFGKFLVIVTLHPARRGYTDIFGD